MMKMKWQGIVFNRGRWDIRLSTKLFPSCSCEAVENAKWNVEFELEYCVGLQNQ